MLSQPKLSERKTFIQFGFTDYKVIKPQIMHNFSEIKYLNYLDYLLLDVQRLLIFNTHFQIVIFSDKLLPWQHWRYELLFPANIYLYKVNNRNSRKRCEIFSKLTIKTPERRK